MYGLNHLNSANHLLDLFLSRIPLVAVWILASLAAKTAGISDFVYVEKGCKISCNETRGAISDVTTLVSGKFLKKEEETPMFTAVRDRVIVEEKVVDRRPGPAEKKEDAVHSNDEGAVAREPGSDYIMYKIPPGEKTDEDINSIAENDMQRSFLILHRDLNVIVSNHKDRLEAFKRTNSKEDNEFGVGCSFQSSIPCDNDPFWKDERVLKILDELVARVQSDRKQNAMKNATAMFENPQVESQDAATFEEVLAEDVNTNPQECLTKVDKEQTPAVLDDHHPEEQDEEKTIEKKKKRRRPSFKLLSSSSSSSSGSDCDLPPPIVVQSIESETENEGPSDRDNCKEIEKSVNKEDQEEQVPIHYENSEDVGKTVNEVVQSQKLCGIEVYEKVRIHYKLQKNDEVPNISYIDPMRLDDSDWPSGNPSLKSIFMKKNGRYLKEFSRIEKDITDFCFHHHRNPNLYDIYDFSFMHMQSYVEKLFFGKEPDLNEETVYSMRSSWHFSMKQMVQLNDLKSVSFFMIPVCFDHHFVAVAVNFDQSKIQYLDNILDNCLENSQNWKMVQILIEQFSIFLKDMEHPRASEVESFPFEEVALAWKSPVLNIDCGVFVMHHIEHFQGDHYMKEDLAVV